MVTAHPLTGSPTLPVPPLVLAALAVVAAALVLSRVRAAASPPGAAAAAPREPRWLWAPRLVAALVLLLLVAVARLGPPEEPQNLAAVAVVHLIWPLLLVAAALAGPLLWRAVDPWWALGSAERLLGAPPDHRPGPSVPAVSGVSPGRGPEAGVAPGAGSAAAGAVPASVWPAVVTGAAWAAFAAWHAVSIPPRALAAMLAAYTLVLLAGCLALGRWRWLPRADAAGLVVSWTGLLRGGGLVRWRPPAGAAALLGAVFGGAAFVRVRISAGWARLAVTDQALLWERGGAVAAVVLGAAAAYAFERWAARRGAAGSVAAALVPVAAATAVAAVLRRTMVTAQLFPQVATDPFARGWRLLGEFGELRAVDVNPWGSAVQHGLALAVVTLGAVAGAWVVARRVRGVRARDPAAFAVYVTTFLAALVVTSK